MLHHDILWFEISHTERQMDSMYTYGQPRTGNEQSYPVDPTHSWEVKYSGVSFFAEYLGQVADDLNSHAHHRWVSFYHMA